MRLTYLFLFTTHCPRLTAFYYLLTTGHAPPTTFYSLLRRCVLHPYNPVMLRAHLAAAAREHPLRLPPPLDPPAAAAPAAPPAAAPAAAALGTTAAPALVSSASTAACRMVLTSSAESLALQIDKVAACAKRIKTPQAARPVPLWLRVSHSFTGEVRLSGGGAVLRKEKAPLLAVVQLEPRFARRLMLDCSRAGTTLLAIYSAGSPEATLSIEVEVTPTERLSPVGSLARNLARSADDGAIGRGMRLLIGEGAEAEEARAYVDALMADGDLPNSQLVFPDGSIGAGAGPAARAVCLGCNKLKRASKCPALRCRTCCEAVHGCACEAHAQTKAGTSTKPPPKAGTSHKKAASSSSVAGEGGKRPRTGDDDEWLPGDGNERGRRGGRSGGRRGGRGGRGGGRGGETSAAPPKPVKQPTETELGKALEGHRVLKEFDRMGTFEGTILKYRPRLKVFMVQYKMKGNREDTLDEELPRAEVESLMANWQQSQATAEGAAEGDDEGDDEGGEESDDEGDDHGASEDGVGEREDDQMDDCD